MLPRRTPHQPASGAFTSLGERTGPPVLAGFRVEKRPEDWFPYLDLKNQYLKNQ